MKFNDLVKKISFETFSDVIAVSPRKVRESLFSHYGIKAKGRTLFTSPKDKKEQRIKHLHSVLKDAANPREQEFLKELFRNWLFHQRPLLKETLDFLGVENDNGLVEVETEFFKDLDQAKITQLINHLTPTFPKDAILVYLTFMEVPKIETYID